MDDETWTDIEVERLRALVAVFEAMTPEERARALNYLDDRYRGE